jgi:hypothetical protein
MGGHPLWGTTLLGAAESLLQSTGGAWWPADRVEVENNRQRLQSALSHEDFITAWAVKKISTFNHSFIGGRTLITLA